jgi:hypothetical protein
VICVCSSCIFGDRTSEYKARQLSEAPKAWWNQEKGQLGLWALRHSDSSESLGEILQEICGDGLIFVEFSMLNWGLYLAISREWLQGIMLLSISITQLGAWICWTHRTQSTNTLCGVGIFARIVASKSRCESDSGCANITIANLSNTILGKWQRNHSKLYRNH